MNRLPLAVGIAKLVGYLLNLEHPDGASKAKFLLSFGFDVDRPETLADALLEHGKSPPIEIRETRWGPRYTIEAVLPTPDRRNPMVRTIWQPSGPEEPLAQLVSLVPLTRRKRRKPAP